jgi:LysR family glycine cleavage system transcriptional activator
MPKAKTPVTEISNRQSPLRALRSFCAAARHQSFKLAAEELFVTASAVSHQVKGLEDDLGVGLFDRGARALTLTEAGQALFDDVDPLVRQINLVVSRFRDRHQRQTLRISVQPFFASELFVPRLAEFSTLYPDIDMQIDTSNEAWEHHPPVADVSIRVFRSAPPKLVADAFYPLRLVPACSPALYKTIVDGRSKAVRPFPMIVHSQRSDQWQLWSASAGIEVPKPLRIIELNSTVAVVRAAQQELGVAIVPMPLSQQLFASGQLVPLYEHEAPTTDRFYFVCSPDMAATPAVQALRKWVLKTFSPLT